MHTKNLFSRSLFLIATGLAIPGEAALAQTYHMRLAGPSGTESNIFAIDQTGRCAGVYNSNIANAHVAYTFDHRTVSAIPPLLADSQSDAFALNGSGAVFGVSYDLGELNVRSFRNLGGTNASLGSFVVRGTNELGDVVGFVTVTSATGLCVDHAASIRNGILTDLLTLQSGTNSYAYAINNLGQAVGRSDSTNDAGTQGALWQASSPMRVGLGTIGGTFSEAYSINDHQTVVGVSTNAAGEYRAVRFGLDASGFVISRTNLGVLPAPVGVAPWSYAYGVNNLGQIVGTSSGRGAAWINGRIQDLNTLAEPPVDWRIEAARAINDSGSIAAQARGADGYKHAVLLVPCLADADRSDHVNADDIFAYLDSWFASMGACPTTAGAACPADIDFSGAVSADDIFAFLDEWFAMLDRDCPIQ